MTKLSKKYKNVNVCLISSGLSNLDAGEMVDLVEKALAYHKQMYNLAKTKKAPKIFIKNILMEAFDNCVIGYIGKKYAFKKLVRRM